MDVIAEMFHSNPIVALINHTPFSRLDGSPAPSPVAEIRDEEEIDSTEL